MAGTAAAHDHDHVVSGILCRIGSGLQLRDDGRAVEARVGAGAQCAGAGLLPFPVQPAGRAVLGAEARKSRGAPPKPAACARLAKRARPAVHGIDLPGADPSAAGGCHGDQLHRADLRDDPLVPGPSRVCGRPSLGGGVRGIHRRADRGASRRLEPSAPRRRHRPGRRTWAGGCNHDPPPLAAQRKCRRHRLLVRDLGRAGRRSPDARLRAAPWPGSDGSSTRGGPGRRSRAAAHDVIAARARVGRFPLRLSSDRRGHDLRMAALLRRSERAHAHRRCADCRQWPLHRMAGASPSRSARRLPQSLQSETARR